MGPSALARSLLACASDRGRESHAVLHPTPASRGLSGRLPSRAWPGIRAQPRALLRAIEGLTLVEIADTERCCGSAGIYNLTHPDISAELQRQKVANIVAAKPDLVVSANPGCILQLAAGLEAAGSHVPVAHFGAVPGSIGGFG